MSKPVLQESHEESGNKKELKPEYSWKWEIIIICRKKLVDMDNKREDLTERPMR